MKRLKLLSILLVSLFSTMSLAEEKLSFENFELLQVDTEYRINTIGAQVEGMTKLTFKMLRAAPFFFHFNGSLRSAALDGKSLKQEAIKRKIPLGARSPFYILNSSFRPGETHTLLLRYRVDSSQFRLKAFGGTPAITFGTRYENGEGVGPDAIMPSINRPATKAALMVDVNFDSPDIAKSHIPLCHCKLTTHATGFRFDFGEVPLLQAYFALLPAAANTPIYQFDVDGVMVSLVLSVDGIVESERESTRSEANRIVRETFAKMNSTFGRYQHGTSLVVFLFKPYGTSMEYRGAVQSTPALLRHELIHQWFATAVSPTEYNDIWLNEAITIWLRKALFGEDEPWSGSVPALTEQSPAFNLAGAPALFEGYSRKVYTHGVGFLNLVDLILKRESKGELSLLPVLQEFYRVNVGKQITTRMFVDFLGSKVNYLWLPLFRKQILGAE